MNTHRLLPTPLLRRAATRGPVAAPRPDGLPSCLRSEAFAEDLAPMAHLARGRALALPSLPAPARGTARSTAVALWAASALAAVLAALALGLGG